MKWPVARIDQIAETGTGGTPLRKEGAKYFGGAIPWIKSGELKDALLTAVSETITDDALSESNAKLVPPGAVLIALYGATVGRTAILGFEATTNQAVCHIIPDKRLAEPKYVWYALRAELPELLRKRVGGAQPNISQHIIRSTKLPLPSTKEQRRIVELLEQADGLRRQRAEADQLADLILPALFHKMFGDRATNPKGWPRVRLETVIAETRNGLYKHADFFGRGTQILKMFNILEGRLNLERVDRVELTAEELGDYGLESGDILVNRVNTPELVGKCAVIPVELGAAVFESKNIRVRLKSNEAEPNYVAHFLNTSFGHGTLCQGVKHAIGMATINNSDLRNCQLPLPPIEMQREWAKHVASVRGITTRTESSMKNLETLFQVLLHRAFTGELTAKWREAHLKELLAEMEIQSRLLRTASKNN
jgi:type I restriction enzyme S subunit